MSNKTKRLARSQRNYHDGWYMLTPAFDPQKMVKGKIGSEEFIVQGGVNGLMFVARRARDRGDTRREVRSVDSAPPEGRRCDP
jgi:hypothetical protein